MGSQRVGKDLATEHECMNNRSNQYNHPLLSIYSCFPYLLAHTLHYLNEGPK